MSGHAKAATFTVDAEIYSMRGEPSPAPEGQCLCGCGPLGHVFCFGVRVPSVTRPGTRGDRVPGSVSDWISDTLHRDHRGDNGRKVRVTLEVLPGDGLDGCAVGRDDLADERKAAEFADVAYDRMNHNPYRTWVNGAPPVDGEGSDLD